MAGCGSIADRAPENIVRGPLIRELKPAVALELRQRALRAGIRRFTATMFRDNKGALALAQWFGPTEAVRRYGGVVELSGSWQAVPDGWGRLPR